MVEKIFLVVILVLTPCLGFSAEKEGIYVELQPVGASDKIKYSNSDNTGLIGLYPSGFEAHKQKAICAYSATMVDSFTHAYSIQCYGGENSLMVSTTVRCKQGRSKKEEISLKIWVNGGKASSGYAILKISCQRA